METKNIYPTSSYNLVNTMPIAEGELIALYQDNKDTIIFVLNKGILYEGFSLSDLMELGGGFKSKEEAISYLKEHSNEEGFNDNMKYFFS